ncbi:MAG: D-alanine--D-alanine ligase [Candidatus Subteraquimicrobiales bacterium]|nr:D-alanine--D-alanine ligase [Candidatus Subteraquimicrobiales bacterium]
MKEKIVVLMGGRSLEREISLKSGHRVSEALREMGHPVVRLDVNENLVDNLRKEEPDLVYIALHGKYGEDGIVQELLEIMGIPYTGPGVFSSIIGFDKAISKEIFVLEGIPTPSFYALSLGAFKEMGAPGILEDIVKKLGLPLIVKPARQGSALGIKYVKAADELPQALISALSYDYKVIIEKYIKGTEVAVSLLGNETKPQILPIVEIVPHKDFFDFESMYTLGATEYFVPARLSDELVEKVKEIALKVHSVLKCRDISRVDIIVSEDGTPYVLELNTSPGMTETSLLPMAAEAAGLSFPELVEKIVEMALKRKG